MNVTLFVAPLLDPEEEDEQAIERIEAILDDLNERLGEQNLPRYEDPGTFTEDMEYWSAMLERQWMDNLHLLLESLRGAGKLDFEPRHLLDPAGTGLFYFPIDFPEPIPSRVEDEMIYASCQGLLREVGALATQLGIPVERFAIDLSGDGSERRSEWVEIYEELAEQGAPCTRLGWTRTDRESVLEQIRDHCATTGADEQAFIQTLIDDYGSLEEYIEMLREELPSDEELNIGLVFTLVSLSHGCQYAIERGLTLGIG